ncbi:MAG: universal stress protein [Caldilineaceae bacterium]
MQSIVAHAQELAADLIVICSHGGNSVQKRLFGSIAQAVVAHGGTPVLLVNPETVTPDFHCTQLLVALDGNHEHEAGLHMAAEMAQTCHAQLDLVLVIPTRTTLLPTQAVTGRLLPQATTAFLDSLAESGLVYLEEKQLEFADSGLEISCTVQRGDPAEAIAATAAANNTDLIVLATHGKGNLDAFWSGSVTPRLVAGVRWPLLLVPVEGGESQG